MEWCGLEDGCDRYEGTLPGNRCGLYWYFFQTLSGRNEGYIGRTGETAGVCSKPSAFQLTVYESPAVQPEFIKGGVFYHIFVDRFYGTGARVSRKDAVLRDDWGGQPEWRPDQNGEILNNDFFGGNLEGILEKLPYLEELGVSCIYLSPVFEAYSSHKYDTGDYDRIDPMFGTEADFSRLCKEAKKRSMRVICDGVFSHTGADSVYFNREGNYPKNGAYQSKESPYYKWFMFQEYPEKYSCWWNFKTLPTVNKEEPSFREFICGADGIVRKWLRAGASGWRLDVADELPDDFLTDLCEAARQEKPDALLVGEVWEDASNKAAYGVRRHYLQGRQLGSVMNYPFRTGILQFIRQGDASALANAVDDIVRNYPPFALHCLMNGLGTHDTVRALTALGGRELPTASRAEKAAEHMGAHEREWALSLMKLAVLLQMTLPGVPCVYYGDEAGMEGYADPFNRACYPWGQEEKPLQEYYRKVIAIRRDERVFRQGGYETLRAEKGLFAFRRYDEKDELIIAVNRGTEDFVLLEAGAYLDLLTKKRYDESIVISPNTGLLLRREQGGREDSFSSDFQEG